MVGAGVHAAAAAEQPARSSTAGFLRYADFAGEPYNVSYDKRSLLVNGERSYFASVGVHYPRFSEGQWDDIFLKAKNDGYNMVQTYFFHNAHQPKLSQWPWNMEGPANLTLFLEKAAKAGMFVDLRIGPYVCAEWSWGGYPYDLANVPGLVSRSDNPQWESYMRAVVLNVTREFRDFFADRGGPIALGQVENELHTSSQPYVDWCGQLAEETDVKIPWGMCNGNSATNTINTCNGGDCTSFIEENGQNGRVLIDQPALWTENWMGWFDDWGQSFPAGDWTTFESTEQSASKAYGILRWTARGGSHVNFYNVRVIVNFRSCSLCVVCAPDRELCGWAMGVVGWRQPLRAKCWLVDGKLLLLESTDCARQHSPGTGKAAHVPSLRCHSSGRGSCSQRRSPAAQANEPDRQGW